MSTYDPLDSGADPFRPPAISTIVHCLHCGEEYDSYRIEWRVETDTKGQPHGFWCCPIENCGGRGFGFDIFPVDPDYRDENGDKMWMDDEEEADGVDEEDADVDQEPNAGRPTNNGSKPVENGDGESLPF